ncbi:sigma-w pathway protein ysdB [Neobacillus cucumis]|uniref:sigma-w pathway protein ysdB n=1 Tax=Neobacillus cucumis TaxID=1740721 RepID=UPI0018DFB198|nr:sigma-w pathway protein ysdB [Neobacillus cucumis]MBI0576578.1 sigma-w pathway protein ysdB [Neobacillus cucumis]
MVWMLRFVLLLLLILFFYYVSKSFLTPNRKLKSARKQKRFLLLDSDDVRRNFLLTYKGAVFTGEKYNGSTAISITIWPQNNPSGLAKEDFNFIEKKICEKYPNAEIHWKSPIRNS